MRSREEVKAKAELKCVMVDGRGSLFGGFLNLEGFHA